MNTPKRTLLLAALALLCTLPAAAQSGCIDSPENPTAVLLLVGTAGFMACGLKAKYAARRASKASQSLAKSASDEAVS